MNLGKRSGSFSAGPRGVKLTLGTKGNRASIGIPGSGLSYSETSGDSSTDKEPSGCGGCLAQILVIVLMIVGISMCVNSGKKSHADKKSAAKTTAPPPSITTLTPLSEADFLKRAKFKQSRSQQ